MKRIIGFVFIAAVTLAIVFIFRGSRLTYSTRNNSGDYVVLLHGLGRTSWSMHFLGSALAKKGYRVINVNYPSRTDTVEHLVDEYLTREIETHDTDQTKRINFVTHSMGGIMTRYFLAHPTLTNLGRVVMIAPPNAGSEAADRWSQDKRMRRLMGPAIDEMTTEENNLVHALPPPYYDVGIIAGKNDEKISVARTKLSGMKDFLVVDKEHTFIMMADEVIEAIAQFLTQGKFK